MAGADCYRRYDSRTLSPELTAYKPIDDLLAEAVYAAELVRAQQHVAVARHDIGRRRNMLPE